MTSVYDEFRHTRNQPGRACVIVIGDSKVFNGNNGYPTFLELRDFLSAIDPHCMAWVENDIITASRIAR